jgi:hypothetical protein
VSLTTVNGNRGKPLKWFWLIWCTLIPRASSFAKAMEDTKPGVNHPQRLTPRYVVTLFIVGKGIGDKSEIKRMFQ